MMRFFVIAACLLMPLLLRAGDIPAKPARYFNDYAHVVDAETGDGFNSQLEDFERQTSNQIVVAVYPKLQTDDSVDDFCYRTFQAWQVGQAKLNNGAVLFVFVQDHKMWIQTGYGLEGSLPDVTCERIIEDEIAPHFKQGDYAGGLSAGITAILAAAKNEYKGTGQTVEDKAAEKERDQEDEFGKVFAALFLILWLFLFFRRTRGIIYGSGGVGRYGGFFMGGGGGGFSGGGGFGGGGGFSGGGGSSGGGGAGGGW